MTKSSFFTVVLSLVIGFGILFSYIHYQNHYSEISPTGYSNVTKMISQNPRGLSLVNLVGHKFENEYISVGEFRIILNAYNSLHGAFISNPDTEATIEDKKLELNDLLVAISE